MDYEEDTTIPTNSLECYKILENTYLPLRLLNYKFNNSSIVILWNKFSIIAKKIDSLSINEAFHYPQFIIKNIYLSRNIFLCLDQDCLLHFTILRKRENQAKLLETLEFKTIAKHVLRVQHNDEEIFVLIKKENYITLYIYTIIGTSKMKVRDTYKIKLNCNDLVDDELQMEIQPLKYFSIDFISSVFHIEISQIILESQLLLVTKSNVLYWTLLDGESKTILNLSVLIACPLPIKDLHIESNSRIYLSLTTGSIIVIFCDVINRCLASEIIHLNSSIERITFINESVLYTDGQKLWHTSIESSNNDFKLKHKMLNIKMPYDFFYIKETQKAYCISIYNIIYIVNIPLDECIVSKELNSIFQVPKNLTDTKKIISAIHDETNKNEKVLSAIMEEENYIVSLFLNRKKDSLLEHFIPTVKIYDISNLECEDDIVLIENTRQYSDEDYQIYVVEFEISKCLREKIENMNKSNNKLWHLDIQIKLNNVYDSYNASLQINKTPNLKIALPISQRQKYLHFSLETKLVALTPGIYNKQHVFWCIMPSKTTIIDSLYYLKLPVSNPRKRMASMTTHKGKLFDRITDLAIKNCGLLFDVDPRIKKNNDTVSYYIKLPQNLNKYAERFADNFLKKISDSDAVKLKEEICNSDFIDREKPLRISVPNDFLEICNEKMEGNFDRLRISSTNIDVCWDVYKFLLNILRNINYDYAPKTIKAVPHFDYMILQVFFYNYPIFINNMYNLSQSFPNLFDSPPLFKHVFLQRHPSLQEKFTPVPQFGI